MARPVNTYEDLVKIAKDWEIVDVQVKIKELELDLRRERVKLNKLTGAKIPSDVEQEIILEEKKLSYLKKALAAKSLEIDVSSLIL